jgi:hypothetical protein
MSQRPVVAVVDKIVGEREILDIFQILHKLRENGDDLSTIQS